MSRIPGLDVSYWQPSVNWPQVRASGQWFVFIKATEGESYADPKFSSHWSGARSAGLLRGAYCFFHPNRDPQKQAAHFVNTVKNTQDDGELPPVLDLEAADGMPKNKILARARLWLEYVEQAFDRKPIIYSNISFLEGNFSEADGNPPAWAREHPLWLGWYPNQYTPGMNPLMPRGWTKWTFWQYNNKGSLPGIGDKVDLDWFNGTLEELYALAGLPMPAQAPLVHTVAAGETFLSIASRYAITLLDLLNANPQLLKVGERLTIPTSRPSGRTYTVAAGDTLSAIAARFGTTVSAIAAANDLADPNRISVGQVLIIPA